MSNNNSQAATFPFLSILGLIFITLKLTGYINWSWWWVLLPIYGGAILFVVIVALLFWSTWDKL